MRIRTVDGHDPWAYLRDVQQRLPTQLDSRIDEFLPHRSKASRPFGSASTRIAVQHVLQFDRSNDFDLHDRVFAAALAADAPQRGAGSDRLPTAAAGDQGAAGSGTSSHSAAAPSSSSTDASVTACPGSNGCSTHNPSPPLR